MVNPRVHKLQTPRTLKSIIISFRIIDAIVSCLELIGIDCVHQGKSDLPLTDEYQFHLVGSGLRSRPPALNPGRSTSGEGNPGPQVAEGLPRRDRDVEGSVDNVKHVCPINIAESFVGLVFVILDDEMLA